MIPHHVFLPSFTVSCSKTFVLLLGDCSALCSMPMPQKFWSISNIVSSHAAGPGFIPGRVNSLVVVFAGFSLNRKTNVRNFGPYSSPLSFGHHIQDGREISAILRKGCFLFYFAHVVLLISLEIMQKNLHQ